MQRPALKARLVLAANALTLAVALMAVIRGLVLGKDGDRGRTLGLLALVGSAFALFALSKAAHEVQATRSRVGP